MKRSTSMLLTVTLLAGLFIVAATVLGAGPTPPNLDRALESQRLLVTQQPGNAAAWNDLGNLLSLRRDVAGAEEAYLRAVELVPESAAYHYNLALLLQDSERFKAAAEQYRRVLELAPDYAWAHYQLGLVNEEMGRDRRAVELYSQAFRLDPMLAFPDVNPHVIESNLVTEAMLRGYRRGLVEPHAPRIYQEPNRITYMMVAPAPDGGFPAEAPTVPPPEAATGDAAAGTPGVPPTLPPGQRRVLDQEDLGKGPINQAEPSGQAGYRPPPSARSGGDRAPSSVRTWRPPPQPEAGGGDEPRRDSSGRGGGVVVGAPQDSGQPAGGGDAQARPNTRTIEPPPPTRLPRGVGSTGRLEMILEPVVPRDATRAG